jgi:hypothetical protein
VTVFGKASRRRNDFTGFLQRRKGGIGNFYTRTDIDRMHPFEFVDIMRRVPGLKVVPTSYFDYAILSTRSGGMMGMAGTADQGCQPTVFIDGARLIDDVGVNNMIRPQDVAAVEVYAGPSETPPQYLYGNCGSILIWTGPEPGK